MAGDNHLTRMMDEVTELNRQSGFARDDGPLVDSSGWSAPAPSGEEPGPQKTTKPTSSTPPPGGEDTARSGQGTDVGLNSNPVDPGPPRFSGVDLDRNLAIIQNQQGIALSENEAKLIAEQCMLALNRYLIGVFRDIGGAHKIEVATGEKETSPQMDIPFEPPAKEPKRGRNSK